MFLDIQGAKDFQRHTLAIAKSFTSWLDLSNNILSAPNRNRRKKLRPREVDVSTTPIKAHKPFGVSTSRVRVLDV